jgi:hypothetical protein
LSEKYEIIKRLTVAFSVCFPHFAGKIKFFAPLRRGGFALKIKA